MVVTMPFGYQVIVDVTTDAGKPEAAPMLAGAILTFAGGISGFVVLGLVWPKIIVVCISVVTTITEKFGGLLPPAEVDLRISP